MLIRTRDLPESYSTSFHVAFANATDICVSPILFYSILILLFLFS